MIFLPNHERTYVTLHDCIRFIVLEEFDDHVERSERVGNRIWS